MINHYKLPWGKQHSLLPEHIRWRKQAEVLELSAKARTKLEWFIYYHTETPKSASRTVKYFGLTRKTFYKWLAVFDPMNLRALEESSRRPGTTRTTSRTKLQTERILILRKNNQEFGKMKLQSLYKNIYHEHISSWQIQRVIEDYDLQRKPSKPDRTFKKNTLSKRRTHKLKKESHPGFLVALDTIVLYRYGRKYFIVTGIDTVSKIAWARAYSTHTSATTKDFFQRLYAIVHGNILNVCHDNGSEFEKHFEQEMIKLKIPQYFSRTHTPKDNPVAERFNRTLKDEFLRMGNFTQDMNELNRRLSRWLLKYNCYRPHQSLNYQTPFQYHFSTIKQLELSPM